MSALSGPTTIPVVVYDEKYPDNIEMVVYLSEDVDVLAQIRGALVSNFGYGKRAKAWAEYFDNNMDNFRVRYQGAEMRLTDFIRVIRRELKSAVKIPVSEIYRGRVKIAGSEYIISQDFSGKFHVYNEVGQPVKQIKGYRIRFIGYYAGEPIVILGQKNFVFGYGQNRGFIIPDEAQNILKKMGLWGGKRGKRKRKR